VIDWPIALAAKSDAQSAHTTLPTVMSLPPAAANPRVRWDKHRAREFGLKRQERSAWALTPNPRSASEAVGRFRTEPLANWFCSKIESFLESFSEDVPKKTEDTLEYFKNFRNFWGGTHVEKKLGLKEPINKACRERCV
jgi:hypothetical protein